MSEVVRARTAETPASPQETPTAETAAAAEPAPVPATPPTPSQPRHQRPQGHNASAPSRRLVMNVVDAGEVRVALLGPTGLEEMFIERSQSDGYYHGNIYKGKVQNVEPALQAAFVELGGEKNGFLHVRDVIPPFGGYDDVLKRRRRKAKEGRPNIEDMLYKGQEILVQIIRETLDHKGPSVTTYLSIPGRYLVLMPANNKRGISKKINDERERNELRRTLDQLSPPKDLGYIIRTAGMGKGRDELQGDLDSLTQLWEVLKERARAAKPPSLLYQESDLVLRAIRDYVYEDIAEIVIDSPDAYDRALEMLDAVMPDYSRRLRLYDGGAPIFNHYGVEDEIEKTMDRSVRLKSGGEIVIEQTEALVAIDVNTGRFRKGDSTRETILAMNREAAVEAARQLRLRDLGGLVMIDFIDMDDAKDRRDVEEVFRHAMKRDRARYTILPISQLGVMELTRQRLRQSVKKTLYQPCPACGGTGVVKGPDPLCLEFLRRARALFDQRTGTLRARMAVPSLLAVANGRRAEIAALEAEKGGHVVLAADPELRLGEMVFEWLEG